jgi:hypothetical protein
MKESPGGFGPASKLSALLNQRLNLYALSASAAGVSLLALAQPAEGKIIYTKTHAVIGFNGIYGLDLNHDGTVDFIIQQRTYGPLWNDLEVTGAVGNGVEAGGFELAAALVSGAPISSHQAFLFSSSFYGQQMAYGGNTLRSSRRTVVGGKWVNVSNRYLGFKFEIQGQFHYGWARLSVQAQGHKITATLTGYAYETVPGKAISAGQTHAEAEHSSTTISKHNPAEAIVQPPHSTPRPLSLGSLALGASSISLRRRQS